MLEKILTYADQHPLLIMLFVAIFLGVATSLISEAIKQFKFEDSPDPETPRSKKVFRWITLGIALIMAMLSLGVFWYWIIDWFLRVIYILVMTATPFMFYHLGGRNIVEAVISKLVERVKKTEI